MHEISNPTSDNNVCDITLFKLFSDISFGDSVNSVNLICLETK